MTPPQHTALTLPAPAKLNLFLHVTGRRPDGYHTLESLVVPIDRADLITLSLRDDDAVTRTHGAAGVAVDDDLAILAARLSIVRLDPMPALAPTAQFLMPWNVLLGVACVIPIWTALIAYLIVRSTVRSDPMRVMQGAA